MYSFALVIFSLGLVCAAPNQHYDLDNAPELFQEFMRTYKKQYATEEERIARFNIFKQNLESINAKNAQSQLTVFGINRFTDMSMEEFKQKYTGLRVDGPLGLCASYASTKTTTSAPEQWDWRDQNIVTRVKDQGFCGSCWAFSTTGNLESQYAMKHGKRLELSESQLVDCDIYDMGCLGGLMTNAIRHLMDVGGSMSEEDYPYTPVDGECRFNKSQIVAKVTGCEKFVPSSEDELKEILHKVGPLAIALDATDLVPYESGILETCQPGKMNHAVLLVGYGVEKGVPYWIIKNSWGTNWGELGFGRVKRNINACNLMDPLGLIVTGTVA